MKALVIVFALVLNACSGTVYYQCGSPYFNEVWSEGNIDCGAFNKNAEMAFDMLEKAGLVPRSERHVFHRVHVMVEMNEWQLDGSSDVGGDYTLNQIHVSASGMTLLHEMLHHWQTVNWVLNTGTHPHWDTNGYYDEDDKYQGILGLHPLRPMPGY